MKYLTSKQIMERYQISPMTLWRWENDPDLGFPEPFVVKRRKLYDEEKVIKWERDQVRRGGK